MAISRLEAEAILSGQKPAQATDDDPSIVDTTGEARSVEVVPFEDAKEVETELEEIEGLKSSQVGALDVIKAGAQGGVEGVWDTMKFAHMLAPTNYIYDLFDIDPNKPIDNWIAENIGEPDRSTPATAYAARVGEFVAPSLLTTLGFLRYAKNAQLSNIDDAASLLVRLGKGTRNQLINAAKNKPKSFAAEETGVAAVAGLGYQYGSEVTPDNEAVGGTVGGLLAGVVAPSALFVARTGVDNIASAFNWMKSQFNTDTAVGRTLLNNIVKDKDDVIGQLETRKSRRQAGKVPSTESGLSLGQIMEDEGLLALESYYMKKHPSFQTMFQQGQEEGMAITMAEVRKALDAEAADGTGIDTFFRLRTERRLNALDARIQTAVDRAQSSFDTATDAKLSKEANSALTRKELEDAYDDVSLEELDMWDRINGDMAVPPVETRAVAEDLLARPKDYRFLNYDDKFRNLLLDITKKGDTRRFPKTDSPVTLKELNGVDSLRSRILSEIRNEKGLKNPNRSKIAKLIELEEAILTDIERGARRQGGGQAAEIKAALTFTRVKNEKFRQGTVGKILNFEEGGAQLNLNNDNLLSGVVTGNVKNLEDTLAPFDFSLVDEAGEPLVTGKAKKRIQSFINSLGPNKDNIEKNVKDWLRQEYADTAGKTGAVNRNAAIQYKKKYRKVLERYPDLKAEIDDSIRSGEWAKRIEKTGANIRKEYEKKAYYLWNKEGGDKILRKAMNDYSPDDMNSLKQIVDAAKKDKTGDALAGLRRQTHNYLTADIDFNSLTAAEQLAKKYSKHLRQLKMVYEKPQLERMETLIETMRKYSRRGQGSAPESEPILTNQIGRNVGAVFGAQVGGRIASGLGSGNIQTPGRVSNVFQAIMKKMGLRNANEVLQEALLDDELALTLMKSVNVEKPKRANKGLPLRLNSWLVSIGVISSTEEGFTPEELGVSPDAE